MKRFIRNTLVFIIILSMVTVALNYMYGKAHNADPETNKFFLIPETIYICNFGSSHGMKGFNYEGMEEDYGCFNFALTSQYLSYDYRLFQYYGNHIAEGAVVFIPVSYHSLFGMSAADVDNLFSINKRYYSILPASLIKGYDFQTDICVRYFPALTSSMSNVISTLLKIKTDDQKSTEIDVDKHAAERADAHVGNGKYYDADGNRIENQEEIDALYDLIKDCQARDAIPILITMPFLHEYTEAVDKCAEDFYDHFYSIIGQIVWDTGVEYYDYAFDERFVNEYSWFWDADHLNSEGARNFTNILMDEIVYAKGYLDK